MKGLGRFGPALVASCILLGALAPVGEASNKLKPVVRCSDRSDATRPLKIPLGKATATGAYAVPSDRAAQGLVVFAHGYGHTSYSWLHHMKRVADKLGVIAVTMDYRGTPILPDADGNGLPESGGWHVMAGAEDSIAAAQIFDLNCPSIETITIMGVSMGGNASGLAVALVGANGIQKIDGTPLFDYWIDVEGATNVIETYLEARLVALSGNETAVNAQKDIESEMGGPIESKPEEYQRRSVIARIDDIKSAELDGAIVIHGLDDGLVPYNQSRDMATALAEADVSTDLLTVARKDEDSERETTITGYAMDNVDPNWRSPLAGHASETSTTHIVMKTAFARLALLMSEPFDLPFGYREFLVDGELGTRRII